MWAALRSAERSRPYASGSAVTAYLQEERRHPRREPHHSLVTGIGWVAVISEIVLSSVIFQPWITMLWSSSSSQTVGDPLFGVFGSTPMNRSAMAAILTGVCMSLHIPTISRLARKVKARSRSATPPERSYAWRNAYQ